MNSRLYAAAWRKKVYLTAMILLSLATTVFGGAVIEPNEKIIVGGVEEIVLLPWGIKLLARIDTGATTSCLAARDIRLSDGMIEFRLPEKYGGALLRAPIKGRRNIKTAHGTMKRPIVELELCIGNKRIPTAVSLADRSQMDYPLLIGRNVLVNDFLVDVSKAILFPPTCLEGKP